MEGRGALLEHPRRRPAGGAGRLGLPRSAPAYAALRDHLAVYAGAMDRCFVGEEAVTPQPGGFYGGWITRRLKGPFKGGPGSTGW